MRNLYQQTAGVFIDLVGREPELLVQAPGRVNLIGEHTDYNEGLVLPCAINFQTVVAAGRRQDKRVRVFARNVEVGVDEFGLDAPIHKRASEAWANYIRGAATVLLRRGAGIAGADLVINGDIPRGVGLSSSASLLVAVIETFRQLFRLEELTSTDVALLAQEAENSFVGVKVGIMDQLISAQGVAGHALFIDCRSLKTRQVRIPPDVAIVIVDSGVGRGLVESAYNERREQCSTAAAFFRKAALRDLTMEDLVNGRAGLNDVVFRRARHVVSENRRVIEACKALEDSDLIKVGRLMVESHISMRDDFEITVPKVDELIDILNNAIGGMGGARMTGGGFGGCVVALVSRGLVCPIRDAVMARYLAPNGRPATIYVCSAESGMMNVE